MSLRLLCNELQQEMSLPILHRKVQQHMRAHLDALADVMQ